MTRIEIEITVEKPEPTEEELRRYKRNKIIRRVGTFCLRLGLFSFIGICYLLFKGDRDLLLNYGAPCFFGMFIFPTIAFILPYGPTSPDDSFY